MILPGDPERLGATVVDGGVNFALFSSSAELVKLCLFDANDVETQFRLARAGNDVWHGFVPDCQSGQRYGFRAHGRYEPTAGLRFNVNKLLVDPYARALAGKFQWHPAVLDFAQEGPPESLELSTTDSAPFVPRSVVTSVSATHSQRPRTPWSDSVIYETNLRGFTQRHPDLSAAEKGRFSGLGSDATIAYLKSLGITAVELMPIFAFVDEYHLHELGLRNAWGYNTLSFFAPMPRYGNQHPLSEIRTMVNNLHDAGLEVILDVAYNHTAEGDGRGPTLSFRGIDNLAYYRVEPDAPARYINDTGTGNTVNADHPRVQSLILDSLRYWAAIFDIDGFRFDLAPVLGRHAQGFSQTHPLLTLISKDPILKDRKLIAEPWDPGPGGYQLGKFPSPWSEWNDQFRDSIRRFWRGDPGAAGEFAARIHGSADLFDDGRPPFTSVNFVTAHDGFTLTDCVSYESRHNQANGEHNRDGHAHNYSVNHGIEGPTDEADIVQTRHRHRINLVATLLFSQGAPMLLAGDELSRTQNGNNNAYAQDNETTWIDWSRVSNDDPFLTTVRELIRIRRALPLLRHHAHIHNAGTNGDYPRIQWLNPDGHPMTNSDWANADSFALHLFSSDDALLLMINRGSAALAVSLPEAPVGHRWHNAFVSHGDLSHESPTAVRLPEFSVGLMSTRSLHRSVDPQD